MSNPKKTDFVLDKKIDLMFDRLLVNNAFAGIYTPDIQVATYDATTGEMNIDVLIKPVYAIDHINLSIMVNNASA